MACTEVQLWCGRDYYSNLRSRQYVYKYKSPGTGKQLYLEALRADGVRIVILDSPEIYSEYAPYTYIEDMKEFIDKVTELNRAA